MNARITAPVAGLNGTGVGGLKFEDSVAFTDNEAVIAYCESSGYTVELLEDDKDAPKPEPTPEPIPAEPEPAKAPAKAPAKKAPAKKTAAKKA